MPQPSFAEVTVQTVISLKSLMFYTATALPASSVVDACRFDAGVPLLAVGKATCLEIYSIDMIMVYSTPLYGRLNNIHVFRPEGSHTDILLLFFVDPICAAIRYNVASHTIDTLWNVTMKDPVARPADIGILVTSDPYSRLIAMHAYQGLLKIIPVFYSSLEQKIWDKFPSLQSRNHGKRPRSPTSGDVAEPFNLRLLEELHVIHIAFLKHGLTELPLLAILYQDTLEERHIRLYRVDFINKELKAESKSNAFSVSKDACFVLPVHDTESYSMIVLGERNALYYEEFQLKSEVNCGRSCFSCFVPVTNEKNHFLLGDSLGNLHVLQLVQKGDDRVLRLEKIGEASIPSALALMDNQMLFLGSHYGDSQLISLNNAPGAPSLKIVSSYTNLAPVVDFCVMDLEKQNQSQLVTCSGGFKDGSLNIIHSGVGVKELADLEVVGLKKIWSLEGLSSEFHQTLVLAFVDETRVMISKQDGSIEELEGDDFIRHEATLFCANVAEHFLLQATATRILLLDHSYDMVADWMPSTGETITHVSAYNHYILLSLSGGTLISLEIMDGRIKLVTQKQCPSEVSCLDIAPYDADDSLGNLCIAGFWKHMFHVYQMPSLKLIVQDVLDRDTIPRSVMITYLESKPFIFVGLGNEICIHGVLGDGNVISYHWSDQTLQEQRMVTLGTQPILLKRFKSNKNDYIFSASDRPTVIYSHHQKLLYSNVNIEETIDICQFHTSSFPFSLALATKNSLKIGQVDEVQKLHIRSVKLGEMARRIVHHVQSNCFAILTTRLSMNSFGEESETAYLKMLDDQTFDMMDSFMFLSNETVQSMKIMTFLNDTTQYLIVGTVLYNSNDSEQEEGRLRVFKMSDIKKLKLVHQHDLDGVPYCLEDLQGYLAAGVNSKCLLFDWNTEESELKLVCRHYGHIIVYKMAVKDTLLAIGDLQKSVCVLQLESKEGGVTLTESARDYSTNWVTAVSVLNEDTLIAAESSRNIYSLSKLEDEEDTRSLTIDGRFHLGEMVNVFKKGNLVMPTEEKDKREIILYGTVMGSIGCLVKLTPEEFEKLVLLQEHLIAYEKPIGKLEHAKFREFKNELYTIESTGFIDGDLVERYLVLTRDEQEDVLKGPKGMAALEGSPEEWAQFVEDFRRLH